MKVQNNPFNLRCGDDQFGVDGHFRLGVLCCIDGYYSFINLKYGCRAALKLMMYDLRRLGCYNGNDLIRYFVPLNDRSAFLYYCAENYTDVLLFRRFVYPKDYCPFASVLWCWLSGEKVNHVPYLETIITEFNLRLWKQ